MVVKHHLKIVDDQSLTDALLESGQRTGVHQPVANKPSGHHPGIHSAQFSVFQHARCHNKQNKTQPK